MDLLTGNISTLLKSGIVKTLFKKGNHLDGNYRPIPIVSTFAKILEKLFLGRLCPFLTENYALFMKQFGFRKKSSTVDIIFSFVLRISNALDDAQHVLDVFLDLSNPFDKVNHSLLWSKLEHFEIRGNDFHWLSFLV